MRKVSGWYFGYVLVDPRDDRVRYAGITKDPVNRLEAHIWGSPYARKRFPCGNWIKKLRGLGLRPKMKVVVIGTVEYVCEWEVRAIALLRSILMKPLLNVAPGGKLPPPGALEAMQAAAHTPEAERRRQETLRRLGPAAWKGLHTPEAKKRAKENNRISYLLKDLPWRASATLADIAVTEILNDCLDAYPAVIVELIYASREHGKLCEFAYKHQVPAGTVNRWARELDADFCGRHKRAAGYWDAISARCKPVS